MCVCVCVCVCVSVCILLPTKIMELAHIEDGIMAIVFTNGSRDRGSIPDRVIPKKKMVLDADLLNTQHYKVRIKGKWINPGKGVAPSPTPRCSSY